MSTWQVLHLVGTFGLEPERAVDVRIVVEEGHGVLPLSGVGKGVRESSLVVTVGN